MKKLINSIDEITSNNVISYATIDDNPESSYIYFADIINNLYSNYIRYVEINSSNTFIDYVEINYPDNKPFIHFVKIISEIDFYIRKLKDPITIQDFTNFLFTKNLKEFISLNEDIVFDFSKLKLETVQISENVSIQFIKTISDNYILTDTVRLTVDFRRIFPEIIEFIDSFSINFDKGLQETIVLSDVSNYEFIKDKKDTFSVGDFIDKKSFTKSPTQTFEFAERVYFQFQKPFYDSGIISDTFTIQLAKKPFIDDFQFSDFFDGQLNKIKYEGIPFVESTIKDVEKVIIQNVFIIENFSFNYTKSPFYDDFGFEDSATIDANKLRNENISLVDSNYKFIEKKLVDIQILDDKKSFNLQKYPFYESIQLTQNIKKISEKTKTEKFNFTDYNSFNFVKQKIEVLSLFDTSTLNFTKSNVDYFSTSDKFIYFATKKIDDEVFLDDNKVFDVNKIFTDSIRMVEISNGLLSNYSLEGTFFSEDYVGETIIFN